MNYMDIPDQFLAEQIAEAVFAHSRTPIENTAHGEFIAAMVREMLDEYGRRKEQRGKQP